MVWRESIVTPSIVTLLLYFTVNDNTETYFSLPANISLKVETEGFLSNHIRGLQFHPFLDELHKLYFTKLYMLRFGSCS